MPSNISTASSSYASSTLEHISRARHLSGQLDESQASEYFDTEQIYSIIPDYLFSDAVQAMSTTLVQLDGEFQNLKEYGPAYTTTPLDSQLYSPLVPTSIIASDDTDPLLVTPVFQAQYSRSSDSPPSVSHSSVSICSASTSIISSIYTGKVQDPTYILKNRRKLLEIGVKHNLPALVRNCEESYLQTLQVLRCSCPPRKGSFGYPLAREGVTALGGHVCLAHFRQKFIYIVGLTALRLAFFMGYE